MNKDTKQRLFNNGYLGLKEQNAYALGKDQGCAYRSEDGEKCFIGFSIDDSEYLDILEGENAGGENVMDVLRNSGFDVSTEADSDELEEMQSRCHDDHSCGQPVDFTHIEAYAADHGLTIPS